MTRKIKLGTGAWQLDLEMTITVVNEEKFKKEFETINNFWGGSKSRTEKYGSAVNAGLAMFAQECFQQMAFNNMKDKEWLSSQFNWSNEGIEGYPGLDDLGIRIDDIEPWFIDSDDIDITEL